MRNDEVALKQDFLRHYTAWLNTPERNPLDEPGPLDYPELTVAQIEGLRKAAEADHAAA